MYPLKINNTLPLNIDIFQNNKMQIIYPNSLFNFY